MKYLASLIMTSALGGGFVHAKDTRAERCVREVAKAASDCVKGTNKECKSGIDRAFDACTKK